MSSKSRNRALGCIVSWPLSSSLPELFDSWAPLTYYDVGSAGTGNCGGAWLKDGFAACIRNLAPRLERTGSPHTPREEKKSCASMRLLDFSP
jgi:hypothetical protein